MPKKIQSIGYQIISKCIGIKNITVPSGISKTYFSSASRDRNPFFGSFLTKIIFEEGTTTIHVGLCCKLFTLQTVILPNSSLTIGRYAFSECSSLQQIELPQSISTIEMNAFSNCHSLKSIILPQSIKIIDKYTFAYCYNLEEIDIPKKVTRIGDNAFMQCKKLNQLILPNSIKSIGVK